MTPKSRKIWSFIFWTLVFCLVVAVQVLAAPVPVDASGEITACRAESGGFERPVCGDAAPKAGSTGPWPAKIASP